MELSDSLPTKIYETIVRAGLNSAKQILILSPWDIKKLTGLNADDIFLLKAVAAECCYPVAVTGNKLFEIQNKVDKVSTGCPAIDGLLHGGLRRGSITELYGESGSGKTQIAIQATVHNWSKGVVYICTEDLFPIRRLEQIKQNMPNYNHGYDYGKNTFLEHVTEADELLSCTRVRLPKLLSNNAVSLIVIDSVAGPFRTECTNYIHRAEELRKFAMNLMTIAQKHCIAVICINQVTASLEGSSDKVIPSLGLAWSNMVPTRLSLRKTKRYTSHIPCEGPDSSVPLQVRQLTVEFAPDIAPSIAEFVVTSRGVQAL